jgi:hypothetical protein
MKLKVWLTPFLLLFLAGSGLFVFERLKGLPMGVSALEIVAIIAIAVGFFGMVVILSLWALLTTIATFHVESIDSTRALVGRPRT